MDDLLKDIFGDDQNKNETDAEKPIFEDTKAPEIKDDVQEPPVIPQAPPVLPEKETPPVQAPVFEAKPAPQQNAYQNYYSPERAQDNAYNAPSDRTVFYQPPVQPPVQNANNFDIPPAFNQPAGRQQYNAPNVQPVQNGFAPAPVKKDKNTAKIIIAIIAIIAVAISFSGIVYAIRSSGDSSDNGSSNSFFGDIIGDEEEKNDNTDDAEAKVNSSNSAEKKSSNGNLTVAGVVEKSKNSCVGITVYAKQNDFNYFYNFGDEENSSGEEVKSGEGSGVIMSESGGKTYIMTCAHVIEGGTKYTVTLDDDTEYEARYVGSDAQTDIGVLVIDAKGLQIAEFGDSKDIEVGEDCVAIGCPGGLEFKNSVTKGIVSALDVPIASTIGYNNECIQVDAAINPGNSGGALFNMQGQVIGINSSKIASTEYEGMGFAVPSNTAVNTANSLIKNGYVKGRAKLGITYATVSMLQNGGSRILSALEEKGFNDAKGTMIITEVAEDSDLKGKVEKNDMLVAVNGKTMTSVDVLTSVLSKSKPGDTVKLTIARIEGNNIKTFEVTCKLVEAKE